MNKLLVVAILVVGAWFGATVSNWMHDDPDAELRRKYEKQVQVNDSTSVLLAKERADKKEMQGLLTAAKQLNGKLIAGVKAHIELDAASGEVEGRVDTVYAGGSRMQRAWTFTDTAWKLMPDSTQRKIGVLAARVEVMWPEKSELTWTFVPEPLEPSVGFVRVQNRYLVAVTCDICKEVRVDAPFADPKMGRKDPRVTKTVGAQYDLVAADWTGRAGLDLRLWRGLNVGLEGRRVFRPASTSQMLAGVAVRF